MKRRDTRGRDLSSGREPDLCRGIHGELQRAAASPGALTLAEFETHQRGLAERNKGAGRIRDVRLSEPKQRSVEGVRVLQASREIDWSDNTKTFGIGAQLVGSDRSFTLVSDSPRREWTANNFEGFLRSLVAMAGLKRP